MGLAQYRIATSSASGHCHESAAISSRIFLSVEEPVRYTVKCKLAPSPGKKCIPFSSKISFCCQNIK